MISRHLCIGAFFGLFLGAVPAQAQDNSASGVLLKPLGAAPVAPSDARGHIVSQPPSAWSSSGTLSQPAAASASVISSPIISTPTGVTNAPAAAPAPRSPVPPTYAPLVEAPDTEIPAPEPSPASAASSESYTPQNTYTTPPLRDLTVPPAQGAAPAATPAPQTRPSFTEVQDDQPSSQPKPLPAEDVTEQVSSQAAHKDSAAPAAAPSHNRPSLVKIQDAAPVPAPAATVAPPPVPVAAAPAPSPSIDHTPPPVPLEMPTVPTMADLTLSFSGDSSDLTQESQKKLDNIVRQLSDMADGRLQVRGYAKGEDGSASSARRVALSRVLSVRSYLMDKGIKPTRVDVRAMGSETDTNPVDRVDLLFERQ
jgi:outer membrane protein OmpA-like peptidoglycan-associated protein